MLPWQDLLLREHWTGEDTEMATAARYSRAIRDLKLDSLANDGLVDDLGDANPAPPEKAADGGARAERAAAAKAKAARALAKPPGTGA